MRREQLLGQREQLLEYASGVILQNFQQLDTNNSEPTPDRVAASYTSVEEPWLLIGRHPESEHGLR